MAESRLLLEVYDRAKYCETWLSICMFMALCMSLLARRLQQ